MSRPLLSAIIPTWNRATLVCDAIEAALAQRPGEIEVIVVDDASTDDTAQLLRRRFGSLIRYLRLPRRSGAGAARNAGVAVSGGEWVGFLDSDDLWLPGKLDAEMRVLARFPEADAIVSDSLNFYGGQAEGRSRFGRNGLLTATGGEACWMSECSWRWIRCENGLATCSLTLRRDALMGLGQPWFAQDLKSCEDWELEVRIYQRCRVAVLPEVWSHVRCIDDGRREGRACPGKPRTREQDIRLLKDRLTAMTRSIDAAALTSELAAELKSYRRLTARRLARLESGAVQGAPGGRG